MNPSSPSTQAIGTLLQQLGDVELLDRLVHVIERVGEGLILVDALDFEPHELTSGIGLEVEPLLDSAPAAKVEPPEAVRSGAEELKDSCVWQALGPAVGEVLQAGRSVAEETLRTFPRTGSESEDLKDLDLFMALEDPRSELPSPIRDVYEKRLDALLGQVVQCAPYSIPPVLADVASVVESMVREHTIRLQSPRLRAESYALLADLHELSSRLARALETMAACVIRGLTETPVAEVLPRYASAGQRAARVRSWAVDIEREAEHRVATAPARSMHQVLTALLSGAARAQEARWLRSADRLALQSVRRGLRATPPSADIEVQAWLNVLGAWSKRMRRINHRKLLVEHDLGVLEGAMDLVKRGVRGRPLLEMLSALQGRDSQLDDLLLHVRENPRALARTDWARHLQRILATLEVRG